MKTTLKPKCRQKTLGLFWIAGKREVYFKTREQVRLWAYYRCSYIYIYTYIYIYIYILEAVIASTIYSSTSLYSIGLANRGPVPSLFGRLRTPLRALWNAKGMQMSWILNNWAFFSIAKFGSNFQMGLSENSVPLHPMVNDHYPY